MMNILRQSKGQSVIEYAVLIIIVIGALLAMNVYVKRGLQGNLRSTADDMGSQFEPGNWNMTETTITRSYTTQSFENGESTSSVEARGEEGGMKTRVIRKENINNADQSYWGFAPAANTANTECTDPSQTLDPDTGLCS